MIYLGGKLFETAASINSLQSIEKEGGKLTYIHFLKFIVEEIIKNNYKIAQIMEKFRSIFFSLNQNILQNDLFLQMCDENSLKIIKNKMIKELEDFLFDPLKDFIVFFYSSTLERMVFHYLGQNFQSLNLFIVDVMHNLVFKSQNRIYRLISSVLTLSNNKELFNLKNKMMKKVDKLSLPSLIENQGFIYSNDILSKIEDKTYFERAFSKVHLISEVRTPLMKLELIAQIRTEIINALDQINEDFNLEIDIRKKQNRLDTDQMISLFCYVILKSKHESIIREIKFIEQFIGNKLIEETQWGYLFEIVRSAVDYLLSVESV